MTRRYPERPIVGVGVVVLRGGSGDSPGDREVLLIRRGKPPREGGWSLPGGAQELGETVFEAATREVREETGVEIEVVDTVAVVDSISRDGDGGVEYHYTLVDVAARWRSGEAREGGDAAEVTWADPDALDGYDLWSETLRIIALARTRLGGE